MALAKQQTFFLPDRPWATLMAFCVGNDVVAPGSRERWQRTMGDQKFSLLQNVMNGLKPWYAPISSHILNNTPTSAIQRNELRKAFQDSAHFSLEINIPKHMTPTFTLSTTYESQGFRGVVKRNSKETWTCAFNDLGAVEKYKMSNIEILCEALKSATNLKGLSVAGWGLVDLKPIAELLKCSSSIERLDLSNNGFVEVEPLVEALAVNRSIKRINIDNNPMTKTGCNKLIDACKNHPTLEVCNMPLDISMSWSSGVADQGKWILGLGTKLYTIDGCERL